MDTLTAIKARRSIRKYKAQPIEPEKLEAVLEAARLAPSARNAQLWKFVVVEDQKQKDLLAASTKHKFIAEAPVIIAGVALDPEREMLCGVPAYAVDLAIAMTNITLAACALGLGTCWIGGFEQGPAREALGVPEKYKIVELMSLGYPDEDPPPRPRKELAEIVCRDHFAE
ncbi:MAG: nitroreductase family protein [Limnochordia bacterium]|jgi:nitroreductase|nr:nitroreductase family protein [Bacillota bacterium]HOB09838.1 nitroreductase family protein [Limnochordia bacterium]NLH31326.1 nitroreductase [Bacillota bacterium]HPT93610.1 nitroreductase family protein [Limnochordia bacterium]HPZ31751.1 nitroreductase family protein [Limnochordia bacterium]